jgi:hypothetical protein
MADRSPVPDAIVAQAKADRERHEKRIAELENELEHERGAAADIEAFLRMYARYTQLNGQMTSPTSSSFRQEFDGVTIADAAAIILERKGGQGRATDIIDALRLGGKLKGKRGTHYGTVVQTMQRHDKRFEKVGTGVWRLIGSASMAADPNTESDEGEVPVSTAASPSSI